MNPKVFYGLCVVLVSVLSGCSTAKRLQNWPVFYDAEKGPDHLFIARAPMPLDFYTNNIPEWNHDLCIPAAKIDSALTEDLGELDGRRVIEVRLALTDMYYTGAVMILEEIGSGRFLPVYVQDYNNDARSPCRNLISNRNRNLVIEVGMDYSGTSHDHNGYQITISSNRDPVVTGSFD